MDHAVAQPQTAGGPMTIITKNASKSPSSFLCCSCQDRPSLYQCPRCQRRTCSLTCCLAHKQTYRCNGKRDVTAFINIGSMTDATLHSDLHFLEDVWSRLDSASRQRRDDHDNTGHGVASLSNHPNKRLREATGSAVPNGECIGKNGSVSNQKEQPLHPLLQLPSSASSFAQSRIAPLISPSSTTTTQQQQQPVFHRNHKQKRDRHVTWEQHAAATSGLTVLRLPSSMQRHLSNQTRLTFQRHGHYRQQQQQQQQQKKEEKGSSTAALSASLSIQQQTAELLWTVEWHYHDTSMKKDTSFSPHSTVAVATTTTSTEVAAGKAQQSAISDSETKISSGLLHGVSEFTTLADLVRDVTQSIVPQTSSLKPYQRLSILIKKIPCPANRPIYVNVGHVESNSAASCSIGGSTETEPDSDVATSSSPPSSLTLGEALRDQTVIEYPTLYIVPFDQCHQFNLAIQEC